VGWRIDEIEDRPDDEAKVKFRQSSGGEGEVEVKVRCSGGAPTFEVDDHDDDTSRSGSDSGRG
jgi:hypothetical protein